MIICIVIFCAFVLLMLVAAYADEAEYERRCAEIQRELDEADKRFIEAWNRSHANQAQKEPTPGDKVRQIAKSVFDYGDDFLVEWTGEHSFNLTITGRPVDDTEYWGSVEYHAKWTDHLALESQADYQGKCPSWKNLDELEQEKKLELEGKLVEACMKYQQAGYTDFKIIINIR